MASRFGLEIRAADLADADGLAQLLGEQPAAARARAIAGRLQNLKSSDGVVLVAIEWGPPSGVIAVTWQWTLTADLRTAYVTTLAVDPESRRKGIGRLLLKAASQAARSADCGDLRIVAPLGAPHMRDFCLATGFSVEGDVFARPLRKGR